MVRISGITKHVYENMQIILGTKCVFKEGEEDGLYIVRVIQNAIVKFYTFDSAVIIDVANKKFILERSDYNKVELI